MKFIYIIIQSIFICNALSAQKYWHDPTTQDFNKNKVKTMSYSEDNIIYFFEFDILGRQTQSKTIISFKNEIWKYWEYGEGKTYDSIGNLTQLTSFDNSIQSNNTISYYDSTYYYKLNDSITQSKQIRYYIENKEDSISIEIDSVYCICKITDYLEVKLCKDIELISLDSTFYSVDKKRISNLHYSYSYDNGFNIKPKQLKLSYYSIIDKDSTNRIILNYTNGRLYNYYYDSLGYVEKEIFYLSNNSPWPPEKVIESQTPTTISYYLHPTEFMEIHVYINYKAYPQDSIQIFMTKRKFNRKGLIKKEIITQYYKFKLDEGFEKYPILSNKKNDKLKIHTTKYHYSYFNK